MPCELVTGHLIYYLLGELSPRERRVVEEHVPNCIVCSEELNRWAHTITAISEAMKTTMSAPGPLLTKVMTRVAEEPLARRRPFWGSWRVLAASAAAMLIAMVGLIMLFSGPKKVDLVALEKRHGELKEALSQLDFQTAIPEQAADWLQGTSNVPVRPVSFSEHGVALAGAQVCKQGRQTIAAMLYQTQDEEVGFYEFAVRNWQAPTNLKLINCPSGCKIYSGIVGDCHVVTWSDGTLGYALISCGGEKKLLELAAHAISEPTTSARRSL